MIEGRRSLRKRRTVVKSTGSGEGERGEGGARDKAQEWKMEDQVNTKRL